MITPAFNLTATERVLPKLALDFTTASLDSRITFTRSGGTATNVDSSGHVVDVGTDTPRFDYDPITLACKGLLIEEARTNIAWPSEDYTSSWVASNITVTSNAVVGPSGTQDAASLTATSSLGILYQAFSKAASSITYTVSFYLKSTLNGDVTLALDAGVSTNRGRYLFNLSTGTETGAFNDGAFTNTSGTITPVGNDWYRVTCTTTTDTATTVRIRLYYGPSSSVVYAWGAQLEVGAFATSYIPTTTAQVTRTADVATMTGTNFSNWFNASEGAIAVTTNKQNVSSSSIYASINDGTNNNRMQMVLNAGTNTNSSEIITGGVGQVGLNSSALSVGENTTVFAYKANDVAASSNAGTVLTDTSASIPTVDRLSIGSRTYASSNYLNGHMVKIDYWPQRIINAECQAFSK